MSKREFFLSKVRELVSAHLPSVSCFGVVSFHFVLVDEVDSHPVPSFMLGVRFSVECLELPEVLFVAGLSVDLEDGKAEQED